MDTVNDLLNSTDSVFLTSPGGCGKSYIIKLFMEKVGNSYICTATTGIAGLGIGGVTLHRALGLGLFKGSVSSLYSQMEKKKGLVNKWRSAKGLIIDEISMMDISLFVRASALMSLIRDDQRPWGGLRLILSGDFLQLPPVETFKDKDRTYTYVFEHPIWKELGLRTITLDTPHRFTTREFFDVLSDARHGILSKRLKAMVKSCDRPPTRHATGIIPTVIFPINKDVDMYNKAKLDKLPGDEVIYKAVYKSTFKGQEITTKKESRDRLIKDTRAQDLLVLKKGAQVMLMINTLNDSLCNGSRGVVIGFNNAPIVRFLNGMELEVKTNSWSIGTPQEIDGKLEWENHRMIQIPLRLAYAATAHKTQGMTLDSACICVDKCFTPNHIYVMLSRCKDPEFIYISGWSDDKFYECCPDKKVLDFYNDLE